MTATQTDSDFEQPRVDITMETDTRKLASGLVTLFSRDNPLGIQELILVTPEVEVVIQTAYGCVGSKIESVRRVSNYVDAISRLRREMGEREYRAEVEPIRD